MSLYALVMLEHSATKGGRSRGAKEPKMASIYRYGYEQIG